MTDQEALKAWFDKKYEADPQRGPISRGESWHAALAYERSKAPTVQPERKPMSEGEVQAAWLGQSILGNLEYTFELGIRSAERFHGIKETP
jgi:hypothetical protein